MREFHLRRRVVGILAVSLALALTLSGAYFHYANAATPELAVLPDSFAAAPAGSVAQGNHPSNAPMAIALVLHEQHADQLNALLANLYNPQSPLFHHWLAKGQFNARFAPSASQIAQAKAYLTHGGLQVGASSP